MFAHTYWRVKLVNCMPRGILLAAEGGHAEAVRSRDHPPLIKKNDNLKFKISSKNVHYKGKWLQSLVYFRRISNRVLPC